MRPFVALKRLLAVLLVLSCQSPRQSGELDSAPKRRTPRGERLACEGVRPAGKLLYAYRVPIRFPEREMASARLGFVRVGFDVDSEGRPVNVRILEASMGHAFDEVVREAFVQWIFCPSEFGKTDQKIRFEFDFECSAGNCVDGR